jgi:1-acyl-sn-glycerol-3-phosphate acyltransferase
MGDLLYGAIRAIGSPFRSRLTGWEQVIAGQPALFVANHLGSAGPLAAILSLPLRLYPWVIADMTDARAPAYLLDDFIGPSWHLEGRAGLLTSELVGRLARGLINGIGAVAVEKNKGLFDDSYQRSMELLLRGKHLLIFPEAREGEADPQTHMRPFHCGFGWLCHLYQRETGRPLSVYPTAVCPATHTVRLGTPTTLGLAHRRSRDIRAFCRDVEQQVGQLYRASLHNGRR